MSSSATFTIVESSTTMNWARQTTARAIQARRETFVADATAVIDHDALKAAGLARGLSVVGAEHWNVAVPSIGQFALLGGIPLRRQVRMLLGIRGKEVIPLLLFGLPLVDFLAKVSQRVLRHPEGIVAWPTERVLGLDHLGGR